MKTAFVLLALLALASAACPNKCSGHGTCGGSDKCTCWPNWQGADCSLRTCKYDIAWATDFWNDAHYYAECSGKGLCDRETGECVCFEGYSGSACKRSVCPNDCSGHGKCRLVSELPAATATFAYADWDSDKIQACVCDGGFYGPDCSQRFCPKGDDPLTICDDAINDDMGSGGTQTTETFQVQRVSLRFGASAAFAGWSTAAGNNAQVNLDNANLQGGDIALKFVDNHNETWWTSAIENVFVPTGAGVFTRNIDAMKTALESLPNFKIPGVTVAASAETTTASGFADLLVTFNGGEDDVDLDLSTGISDSSRVSGNQNLLSCDYPLGCMTAGCQPMYQQPAIHVYDEGTTPTVSITADSVLNYYDNTPGAFGTISGLYDATVTWETSVDAADETDDSAFFGIAAGAHFLTASVTAADGTVATYPRQRIPENLDHIEIGMGIALDLTGITRLAVADGPHTIQIAVARCHVTEEVTAHPQREDVECSGRGACDTSTGNCECFEGFYGDHCALQTVLI